MRMHVQRFHPSRDFLEALRLWAGLSLFGLSVECLFAYVVIAFFLGDAGWVWP